MDSNHLDTTDALNDAAQQYPIEDYADTSNPSMVYDTDGEPINLNDDGSNTINKNS